MKIEYFKDLNLDELNLLKRIPALTTILVGAVDDHLEDREVYTGKMSTKYRSLEGETLTREYFEWVSADFSALFSQEWEKYRDVSVEKRTALVSEEISKANDILRKIDCVYANALVESWRKTARAVARSTGGLLGRIPETPDEKKVMVLDMLEKF
ncbi:MAG: hypothetical protein M9887_06540 [Chitinophagales bacterium]|nr:hypothetical protein [Chitinophagales bacterium]